MSAPLSAAEHHAFKQELFAEFARVAKALASPHRLQLLYLLAQRERSVEDLARELELPIANASQHLQSLRRARLVEVRREGPYAYYRLADESVYRLYQALLEVGEARLAEVERIVRDYRGGRDTLEPIGSAELLRRLKQGDVVLLDTRPEEEYRAGHIPGAISMPVKAIRSRLRELPVGREIIAYCRGAYCVFSDEAVTLLRDRGFRARPLSVGLPDWRAAGLPVEVDAGAAPETTSPTTRASRRRVSPRQR
ncbi:MAG TPA: metalloregulator ArsR/SmtB family transcription factor [Gemmatimonadaceae bacterium]|nr:metalloregulator ArsR/SmtB family transcription factor [Gemmatimonadaceae bacterium]